MATYYPISEVAAKRAKQANSWSDYVPGSATAEYRRMVDAAVEIAEAQKARVDPQYHEKIDALLDTYCRRLAANINRGNEIDALLKQNGFRWAPSQGAWQRLLNENGRRAAREVVRLLQGVE